MLDPLTERKGRKTSEPRQRAHLPGADAEGVGCGWSTSDAVVWRRYGGAGFVSAPALATLLIACDVGGGLAVCSLPSCRLLCDGVLGGPLGSGGLHGVGGLTEP